MKSDLTTRRCPISKSVKMGFLGYAILGVSSPTRMACGGFGLCLAVAGFDDKMSFAAAVARRREDEAVVIDENAVIDMTAVLDLLSIAAGVPASRPPRPVPRPVPLPIAPNDH